MVRKKEENESGAASSDARKEATAKQLIAAGAKALDELFAMRFINSVDRGRYNSVATELENSFVKGKYEYPKTIAYAYKMLDNWITAPAAQEIRSNDGVAFGKTGSTSNRPQVREPKEKSKMKCYLCGKYGHIATDGECNPYDVKEWLGTCLLYTSPSPRDQRGSRMPSSA